MFVIGALLGIGRLETVVLEEVLVVLEFGYCGARVEDTPDKALPEFEFDTDSPTPDPITAGLETDEELPEEAFPELPIREDIGLLFVWMWSVKIIDISNQNFSIYIKTNSIALLIFFFMKTKKNVITSKNKFLRQNSLSHVRFRTFPIFNLKLIC